MDKDLRCLNQKGSVIKFLKAFPPSYMDLDLNEIRISIDF